MASREPLTASGVPATYTRTIGGASPPRATEPVGRTLAAANAPAIVARFTACPAPRDEWPPSAREPSPETGFAPVAKRTRLEPTCPAVPMRARDRPALPRSEPGRHPKGSDRTRRARLPDCRARAAAAPKARAKARSRKSSGSDSEAYGTSRPRDPHCRRDARGWPLRTARRPRYAPLKLRAKQARL